LEIFDFLFIPSRLAPNFSRSFAEEGLPANTPASTLLSFNFLNAKSKTALRASDP